MVRIFYDCFSNYSDIFLLYKQIQSKWKHYSNSRINIQFIQKTQLSDLSLMWFSLCVVLITVRIKLSFVTFQKVGKSNKQSLDSLRAAAVFIAPGPGAAGAGRAGPGRGFPVPMATAPGGRAAWELRHRAARRLAIGRRAKKRGGDWLRGPGRASVAVAGPRRGRGRLWGTAGREGGGMQG